MSGTGRTANPFHLAVRDAVADALTDIGFTADPDRDDHWLAPTSQGIGKAGVLIGGDEKARPLRWEGTMDYFWYYPALDPILADIRGRNWPTAFMSVFGGIDEYYRGNADRVQEVSVAMPVDRFVTSRIDAVRKSWQWWTDHFRSMDTALDFLSDDSLLAKRTNSFSGYLLSLVEGRTADADRFVTKIFASHPDVRDYREDYDEMVAKLQRGAELAGAPQPHIPAFESFPEQNA